MTSAAGPGGSGSAADSAAAAAADAAAAATGSGADGGNLFEATIRMNNLCLEVLRNTAVVVLPPTVCIGIGRPSTPRVGNGTFRMNVYRKSGTRVGSISPSTCVERAPNVVDALTT